MSLEAVQKVTEYEQRAMQEKTEAAETAKKLIFDAEKAGRARLDAARAEAEAEVKILVSQAEARAEAHAKAVMEETQRTCDTLRHAAEEHLADAAALIIGKVVGV